MDRVDKVDPLDKSKAANHRPHLSTKSILSTHPEIAANAALVLIAVACSLLDRQAGVSCYRILSAKAVSPSASTSFARVPAELPDDLG